MAEFTEDTLKFGDDYDMKYRAMFVYKHECEIVNRNFIKRQMCPIYTKGIKKKKGDQQKKTLEKQEKIKDPNDFIVLPMTAKHTQHSRFITTVLRFVKPKPAKHFPSINYVATRRKKREREWEF